jgi:hypothetical protein
MATYKFPILPPSIITLWSFLSDEAVDLKERASLNPNNMVKRILQYVKKIVT